MFKIRSKMAKFRPIRKPRTVLESVKTRVVRHSNVVLTYTPTYWPKDGICAGCVDYRIKLYRNPFASGLTTVAAQLADCVFPSAAAQYITYRVPIKPTNYFFGA